MAACRQEQLLLLRLCNKDALLPTRLLLLLLLLLCL
jgi:hypothetical protein